MKVLKTIGETVNSAVDFVVEKNRKFTKITNIKRLIKKETDSIIKSYIILGKHYYSELSDVPDKEMQKICKSIDESKNEIKQLKEKLTVIDSEESCSNFRYLLDEEEPIEVEIAVSDSTEKDTPCICDNECDCIKTNKFGDGKCHCNDADESKSDSATQKKSSKTNKK